MRHVTSFARPISAFRAALVSLTVCAALAAGTAATGVVPAPDPDLVAINRAVTRGEADTLAGMSLPQAHNDFSWVAVPPGLVGELSPWKAENLDLKPLGGEVYVAISRYQPTESTGDHLYRAVRSAEGLRFGPELRETDIAGCRVRHHDVTVRFDVAARHVYLNDRVSIDWSGKPGEPVLLRLNSFYRVTAAWHDGRPVPFKRAGGFLALPGGAPGALRYTLAYDARIPDSEEDFIHDDEAALTAYWLPHTGRLPVTTRVTITAPRAWYSITTGDQVSRTVKGALATTVWNNPLPVCYFTVASGKYTITTSTVGGLQVSAYLLHKDAPRARTAIDRAGGALAWYSSHFRKYPFKHYAVVETSTFPAALECYTFTLVGQRLIPTAIVHEVAHTWWGGLVPNTYTRTLWNESFAEYSDGLYGRMTSHSWMNDFSPRLLAKGMYRLASTSSLSQARDAMGAADSTVGYGKGSEVLRTLERMLGPQKMIACMRRFALDHRAGDDAEWPDFVEAVAKTAGPEWRGFFPAWLERKDLPILRLADVATHPEAGRYVVTGRVVQDNGPYWLKTSVVVSAGKHRTEVAVEFRGKPVEEFRVAFAQRPTQVALDPGYDTLRYEGPAHHEPTLIALHTAHDPLLVVYATSARTEEVAALKRVATDQVPQAYPMALVTVKADTEVTEAMLQDGNVMLLGRADQLNLPEKLRKALPLGIENNTLRYRGEHWTGGDLWGMAIVPHPNNPDRMLVHVAYTNVDALSQFVDQGELDEEDAFFVVRGAGKVVASLPPPADARTVVRFSM